MANSSSRKQREASEKDLLLQRAFLAVSIIIGSMALTLAVVMFSRYEEDRTSPTHIYGEWIEQNVPAYARDRFVVREEGIYVEERIVDTDYVFDGKSLTYTYQGKEYKYVIKDENASVMQRVAPLHYHSLFYLVGKYQPKEETDEVVYSD